MKRFSLLLLLMTGCLLWGSPLRAFEAPDSVLRAAHPDREYYEPITHYTLKNWFSELDVPTCFGVSYTPNRIESVSFYAKMCLEWRLHKNYGWCAAVGVDNNTTRYKNIQMVDQWSNTEINVISGQILYYSLFLGPGYRLPLVANLKEFYEHPYFNKFNVSFMLQPGATLAMPQNVSVAEVRPDGEVRYAINNKFNVLPSAKVSLAFEWFVTPKFSIAIEGCYVQHFMPTILEKAYYDNEHHPRAMYPGVLALNIGFAGFFN